MKTSERRSLQCTRRPAKRHAAAMKAGLAVAISLASVPASGTTPTAVVLCSAATATVLRADRRLDGTSVGVIPAKSCGVISRQADGAGTDPSAAGTWMFLEKAGVGTGWAFVSAGEIDEWSYDVSVPGMKRLKAERDLAAGQLAVQANLLAIKAAELANDAAYDKFMSAPTCPATVPVGVSAPWTGDCAAAWSKLGWKPDGSPTCSYTAVTIATAGFFLLAQCDADGDSISAVYRLDHPGSSAVQRLTPEGVY